MSNKNTAITIQTETLEQWRETMVQAASYANTETRSPSMERECLDTVQAMDDLLQCPRVTQTLSTPDFMNWLADRLVNVYKAGAHADFVLSLRERAAALAAATAAQPGTVASDEAAKTLYEALAEADGLGFPDAWDDLCQSFRATMRAGASAVLAAATAAQQQPYQARVQEWMQACFGPEISRDVTERNHRFLEEAVELVQAQGCTRQEAMQLVDYVYGRPVGEPAQEVGGVLVTLAALCSAAGIDMAAAGETELTRIWTKVEQIRAKQAAKPKHSPLPGAVLATGPQGASHG